MNNKQYQYIIYFISGVILLTLVVQGYWNYLNLRQNRQELQVQVQNTLDLAVDDYYAELAKTEVKSFFVKDSLKAFSLTIKDPFKELDRDSATRLSLEKLSSQLHDSGKIGSIKIENRSDSNRLGNIENIATKMIISLSQDTLDLKKLNSLLQQKFAQNNWQSMQYSLLYINENLESQDTLQLNTLPKDNHLSVNSRSTYLPDDSSLHLHFSNIANILLRQSFTGLLISAVLSLAVVFVLFFLLRVIRKQKSLAAMKDDLVSNITHEFKTPIATVSSALEAIEHFNQTNDLKKNKRYLSMSQQQLTRLNHMVEKLMETATLDSKPLQLKPEKFPIVPVVEEIKQKFALMHPKQTFTVNANSKTITLQFDKFHFENVISNLLDNAVKYGGDQIQIKILQDEKLTKITVADDGEGVNSEQQKQLFDKFYRVPTGNRHDVKGFGIGLYYARKVVQMHGSSITYKSSKLGSEFIMEFPHEQ